MLLNTTDLYQEAHQILLKASTNIGIKASLANADNYNRIWARDSAVSALAIFANQLDDLYPAVRLSILNLQVAASSVGQIPSNVGIDENQKVLVPGDPEREMEVIRMKEGIPVVDSVVEDLKKVGEQFGIEL